MQKQLLAIVYAIAFFSVLPFALGNQYEQGKEINIIKDDGVAWNKVCPVDGKAVDPEVVIIEFNEKNYGFCSFEHAEKFKGDPKLYSQNLNEDGTKFVEKQKIKAE